MSAGPGFEGIGSGADGRISMRHYFSTRIKVVIALAVLFAVLLGVVLTVGGMFIISLSVIITAGKT